MLSLSKHEDQRFEPCPHFGTCGGCLLQDLPPADYAAAKRAAVQKALMKAGVSVEVLAPIIVPPRSRRRAVFKIKSLPEGLHIGFHAAKTHTVTDMHHCDVLTPGLFALVGALRQRLEPLFGVGEAAELHVTETDTGFDCAFRWRAGLTPALTAELTAALSGLGIARLTMGRDLVFEQAAPSVTLGGVTVDLPPNPFLQSTREGEAALQEHVLKIVGRAKTVVDLFKLPLTPAELVPYDAVVLDPPRAGAEAQVRALAKSRVPVIAYVSCDAASFARDAAILVKGGYRPGPVTPIDQFLWSSHIELVAGFRRP